jgi:two-component system, LytTR family, sensor kinase
MEQKLPLSQLYITAISASISMGVLALGMITIAQANILKSIPTFFVLGDAIIALIIAVVTFMICLVNIWTVMYIHRRYRDIKKGQKIGFILTYLLSSIPLIIGGLLIRLFRDLLTQKINLQMVIGQNAIVHQQIEVHPIYHPLLLVVFFLIILLSINSTIHLLLDFVVMKDIKTKLELENAHLKVKNIEATYQQLKQQIHPHFLFNTLSTLKILIKDNPDAEIYLKRLSDFLRASITFNNESTIKVQDELRFCMDYLELQRVRFGEALHFAINIPEEAKSGFLPVFSLQQLIENAIKHNVMTKNSPLVIKIEGDNGRIMVSNNIKEKRIAEDSTGLGLINLAERYRILSGDEVIIRTDNNCFAVSINILKHEPAREYKALMQ